MAGIHDIGERPQKFLFAIAGKIDGTGGEVSSFFRNSADLLQFSAFVLGIHNVEDGEGDVVRILGDGGACGNAGCLDALLDEGRRRKL